MEDISERSSLDPQQRLTLAHFARREAALKAKIVALLTFGIPALFFGPIVLTSMYWAIALLWGFYLHWEWMFFGSVVILVPMLFWTEWHSGGSFYTDAVISSFDAPPMLPLGLTDIDRLVRFMRNPRAETIGLVELFLWGPRQVLEAATQFRRQRLLAAVNRPHAAHVLDILKAVDHANVEELLESESDARTFPALAYLISFDWIGVSKDGKRVWVSSDSRNILNR
ncbi:MAG: hypothetical protein ABSB74_00235 [Tepidisphaeraceae bacterium]